MEVFKAIEQRRSVRRFKEQPVRYEILERCVEAARLAPTAKNVQVIEYVVVDEPALLMPVLNSVGRFAGAARPEAGWSAENRPWAYILAVINRALAAGRGAGKMNIAFDAGLAVENLVLAAEAQGLGNCIITSFEPEKLVQALGLPDAYEPAMLVALGIPDEKPVIETSSDSISRWVDDNGVRHVPKRPLADILHHNGF